MGARSWAAIGNLYKISAAIGFLVSLLIAERAYRHAVPDDYIVATWIGAAVLLVFSILLWNVKGPLVRGNLVLRVLFGVYTLGWIVGTVGIGLIVLLVIYLFTGEPSTYDKTKRGKAPKSPKAPSNFRPSAKIGPAGAMLYKDSTRIDASGIFDSYTPVQVVERSGSAARVVAATGESGWLDLRSLTEMA